MVLVVLVWATPVLAHVPSFPADNTSPEDAVVVPDATKSWSFYDTVADGGVAYYRFTLRSGERLQVGAFTPAAGEFTPSIVLMSPVLNRTDQVPPGVRVPEGMGAIVVEGERPERASYEPFAPAANYRTASLTRPTGAETTYLVAIYEPANRSGPAGVALGYEEAFSPTEYVTVPFDLVRTRLWAGQHPLVVVGPVVLTLLGGLGFLRRRWADDGTQSVVRFGLGGAGVLLLGSGLNTAIQMGWSLLRTGLAPGALVTAVFVAVPVVCGGWVVWRLGQPEFTLTARTRVGLGVAGAAALATWAGFIVGPAILLLVAPLPGRLIEKGQT